MEPASVTVGGNDDLGAMLKSMRPTPRDWTCHPETGVVYHVGTCNVCTTYVRHMVAERQQDNPKLAAAFRRLEKYWLGESRQLDSYKDDLAEEYARGFQDGRCDAEQERVSERAKGKRRQRKPRCPRRITFELGMSSKRSRMSAINSYWS
jgi:hypothetical protein